MLTLLPLLLSLYYVVHPYLLKTVYLAATFGQFKPSFTLSILCTASYVSMHCSHRSYWLRVVQPGTL